MWLDLFRNNQIFTNICLSNLESINAVLIEEGLQQSERLQKLNRIAIHQMSVLNDDEHREYLK